MDPDTEPAGSPFGLRLPRFVLLAEALAWAVTRGVPLDAAVATLPFYRHGSRASLKRRRRLGWLLAPSFHWMVHPWFGDLGWTMRLLQVAEDLNAGEPLGTTLRRRLGRRVPRYYLARVSWAESRGTLPTTLPALAEQMRGPFSRNRRRALALVPSLLEVTSVAVVFLYLGTFVLPRMQEILMDLGIAWPVSAGWMQVSRFLVLGCLGVAIWGGWSVLSSLGTRFPPSVFEWRLFAGRRTRRRLVLEFALAMDGLLEEGMDIPQAALWFLDTTRNVWMRKRVRRFVEAMESGTSWEDAWAQSRLGTPMEDWAMRVAAGREDPAAGFRAVAGVAEQALESELAALERWVAPVATLVLGAFIGFVCVVLFLSLTSITRSML